MTTATLSSLLAIMSVVAVAPIVADLAGRWIAVPSVALEIVAGALIGPVCGLVHADEVIVFLSQLGLCTLMFLAGLEIDLRTIERRSLRRASLGWGGSIVLGSVIGLSLTGTDGPRSGLIVALCLSTTAFGVLLPILRDRRETTSPVGTAVFAGAAIGELGPIVAIAVLLGTDRPLHTASVLVSFAVIVILAARLAAGARRVRIPDLIESTIDSSGQVGVRLVVLVLVATVWFAAEIGLDVLIGAFAAGMVVRLYASSTSPRAVLTIESKLHGLGFGFLVPVFFVVSGMQLDLDALATDPYMLLAVPGFVAALFVARGAPSALLASGLGVADRAALACYLATSLPLIVVVTTIGVQTDRLPSSTAAALVSAGVVSVVVFPTVAARLRDRSASRPPDTPLAHPHERLNHV